MYDISTPPPLITLPGVHHPFSSPSAGIGRSGVFIGADIGMQQLEEGGEVDVARIVSTMRQDRGGMVQTKDQYVFLHQVRSLPFVLPANE